VAVYDPENPVFFPSGLVRLDGDKARSWLTYRFPDEDEGEAASRRQRFFLGFIRRLGQRGDIFANPALAGIFHGLIKTSMDQKAQLRIFRDFAGIDMDRIPVQTVGGTRKEVSGQTLLIPYYDGSQIKEFVRYALTALTRQSEGAGDERVFTVEVLNGTSTTGLAGRTAELLRGFGYDVISIGNAGRNDYESTQVIDRSGLREVGAAFAGVIRCGSISFEPPARGEGAETILQNPEYKADLTLIIGRDFDGRYVTGG
jgi:hypothetical protein